MIVSAENIDGEHRRGRAERDAVHEAQAEQQQAEQGDHHRDRGEHDRAARLVDRVLDRPVAGAAPPCTSDLKRVTTNSE